MDQNTEISHAAKMFIDGIRFDKNSVEQVAGIVIQDAESKEVLMLAYANREALERTIETRQVWLWSRSRQVLWHKGAFSGNYLEVVSIFANCEWNSLLIKVKRLGEYSGVCHDIGPNGKHRPSCFFRQL